MSTTTTYRRDTEHGPALRTITVNEHGNVIMTEAEAIGLLRLARYSPAPDIDAERETARREFEAELDQSRLDIQRRRAEKDARR